MVVLIYSSLVSLAQSEEYDFEKIQLAIGIPQNVRSAYPQEALNLLQTKLNRCVTTSGYGSSNLHPRFVIWPKLSVLSKEVNPGLVTMIIAEYDLTLLIGDNTSKSLISSITMTLKGVGETETKCLIDALKKFNPTSKKMLEFSKEGRTKIIQFYEQQCSQYLEQASTLISQKKYEDAIALCMEVPAEITTCYPSIQKKISEAYELYCEFNCKDNLQKAKAAFAINEYELAVEYLSYIDPTSSCSIESNNLINRIEKELNEEQKKQWEFVLKQHDDAVMLEKLRIQNCKYLSRNVYRLSLFDSFETLFSLF
ncbi:MAG: hypothetical protein H6608_05905 [Flavobacteriales bacterium]|nr:hypothetical protein [Flavobacteriales bacterium]